MADPKLIEVDEPNGNRMRIKSIALYGGVFIGVVAIGVILSLPGPANNKGDELAIARKSDTASTEGLRQIPKGAETSADDRDGELAARKVAEAASAAAVSSSAERGKPKGTEGPFGVPAAGQPQPAGAASVASDTRVDLAILRERVESSPAKVDEDLPSRAKAAGGADLMTRAVSALTGSGAAQAEGMPLTADELAIHREMMRMAQGGGTQVTPAAAALQVQRSGRDEAFFKNVSGTPRVNVAPPAGQYVLFEGRFIPAVLTRDVNSDAPGRFSARATENVYDRKGNLLIPAGTEFFGKPNPNVTWADSRTSAAVRRIVFPNGFTMDLPEALVSDAAGRGGVPSEVDRHYLRSYGGALLLGLLADRASQASKMPQGGAAGGGQVSATGQIMVQTAQSDLERWRTLAPTLLARAGERINIEVGADLVFPAPYGQWGK